MGRIFVSACKCGMGVVSVQPVIVRNALFCVVWSVVMLEFANDGCQAGDA